MKTNFTNVCPNCGDPIDAHERNGCVLEAFIGVLRSRDNLSETALQDIWSNCNVDALWDDLGRVLDNLEAGHYTVDWSEA